MDKVGVDGVIKELTEKGISESALEKINPLFSISGDTKSRLSQMRSYLKDSEIGISGIDELEYVLDKSRRAWGKECKN